MKYPSPSKNPAAAMPLLLALPETAAAEGDGSTCPELREVTPLYSNYSKEKTSLCFNNPCLLNLGKREG